MVDYNKSTGSSGTMRIRDLGDIVEFWINSGNSTTFNHNLPWGYTVNGVTNNTREYDYNAGAGWEKLGSWSVDDSQTVTFRLRDTGTSGFGGPTSFSVSIDRASAPWPPSQPTITNITHNSMTVSYTDGNTNGAPITNRQTARNTSNTLTGANIYAVDKSTTFTGLSPGTTYYWWARTQNRVGWSGWSPVRSAATYRLPDAPGPPIISDITQTTFWASFQPNGNGGSAIVEMRVYFNTTPNDADVRYVTYTLNNPVQATLLQPFTTYYVWARVRNAAGWSPYSEIKTIKTVAGAYITVGNLSKEAIPYVNVGGVWKLARPWVRVNGVWKETF